MTVVSVIFFFNDTATTEIYTLPLHDALPISLGEGSDAFADHDPCRAERAAGEVVRPRAALADVQGSRRRSEEHTSELQSQSNLVCRLLLEKNKTSKGRLSAS